jgi:putative transposase
LHNGYGTFLVSESQQTRVTQYIEQQAQHHQEKTSKEEYMEFLEANGIAYKPEYL